ncbi:MAG: tetratricopeptide repeat protein [Chlorobiales bacterium]|nr:tetratricopeptide repeat protein [Chlorobiales bacterium]
MQNTEHKPEQQAQKVATDPQEEKIERLVDFFLLNKNLLIGVTVGIILIAGGLFFYQQQRLSSEKSAFNLLSHAETQAAEGNWQKAIEGEGSMKGLREIIREYGSTESGNRAKILLGDSFLALNQVDSALAYYSEYKGSNPDLAASAKAGAAFCRLWKKEYPEAVTAFEDASETAQNHALKSSYLADAADVYRSIDSLDTAVRLYKQIIRKYPDYAAAAKARQSLLALAGKTENTEL